MIRLSEHIRDRRDFGALCNYHRVTYAVEVGVDQGNFAVAFLSQWRGEKMYLVDPYLNGSGFFEHDREWDYQCVMHSLGNKRNMCRFIRAKSTDAPRYIREKDKERIGFIYIDGDHSHRAVVEDLRTWWPLVKGGGILAGHDWEWDGVKKAVSDFADSLSLDVFLTHEGERVGSSWYILKP